MAELKRAVTLRCRRPTALPMPSPILTHTGSTSYCTTRDGVKLAMRSVGRGPLIIKAANWLGNLQADAQLPSTRHWVDQLSRRHEMLWYDARGCGLYDREVGEVSLDAWVDDLEAVGADLFRKLPADEAIGTPEKSRSHGDYRGRLYARLKSKAMRP